MAFTQQGQPSSDEDTFVQIIQGLRPSVVAITSYQPIQVIEGPVPEWTPTTRVRSAGVIVDNQGHIATVGYRFDQARKIEVLTVDGTTHEAEVVGFDPITSIALLRVQSMKPLPSARLGDSDHLQVGRSLIVIGNPYGLSHSVSTGIVSGLERVIHDGTNDFTGMIQTNATINPGDSGGLVSNLRGECVGLVASTFGRAPSMNRVGSMLQRLSRDKQLPSELGELWSQLKEWIEKQKSEGGNTENLSELLERLGTLAKDSSPREKTKHLNRDRSSMSPLGAQGINFVMPINTVKWVIKDLKEHGHVRRGFLGCKVRTEQDGAYERIYIEKVVPGGPAATCGLQPGDHIERFFGEEVDRLSILHRLVLQSPPGKVVQLTVRREKKSLQLSVTIGSSPK
jgi:S1-C subfamily serine protease